MAINHVAEAQFWLPGRNDGLSERRIAVAQVHATLALVEQQRIANLIALSRNQDLAHGGYVCIPSFDPVTGVLRPDIAAGLGLEQ